VIEISDILALVLTFINSFEDMVKASNGELSMLSGGEKNGFDKFPREW
jgi:hypothetical protein